MKVSYCSTCKGRLEQLKSTLLTNLSLLNNIDAEWIIVDYHCPNNTVDELLKLREVHQSMRKGKLRLFKFEKDVPFHMSFSKNLSHSVAKGDILFNLDIDNYISDSYSQLITMRPNSYMVSDSLLRGIHDGAGGRIAIPRDTFFKLGGYNLSLGCAGFDDQNMYQRLKKTLPYFKVEKGVKKPINNTVEQSVEYASQGSSYSEALAQSIRQSNISLKNNKLIANPLGMLNYFGEDMSKYLKEIDISSLDESEYVGL